MPGCPGNERLNIEIRNRLVEGVRLLERPNVEIIALACNTVHMHYDAMQNAVRVPIASIIDATIKKVVGDGRNRPLILGTPYTLNTRLYQSKLQIAGVDFVVPSATDRKMLFTIIRQILGGFDKSKLANDIDKIVKRYRDADCVILACTELPLVSKYSNSKLPMYDTLGILAEELYARSKI